MSVKTTFAEHGHHMPPVSAAISIREIELPDWAAQPGTSCIRSYLVFESGGKAWFKMHDWECQPGAGCWRDLPDHDRNERGLI